MFANFENDQKLKADGRWLEACGPLLWGDPRGPEPADKVIVAVTVTQNGVVASGTSHECGTSEKEWMIYIRPAPGQKFRAGKANGTAMLTVTGPLSDPPKTLPWQQQVTLV